MLFLLIVFVCGCDRTLASSVRSLCDEHCDHNTRMCYGTAGKELEVPCGPERISSVTYYNGSNGEVLLDDSEHLFTVNLSMYNDQTTIVCKRGDSRYEYYLNVCCKFQKGGVMCTCQVLFVFVVVVVVVVVYLGSNADQPIPPMSLEDSTREGDHNDEKSLDCPLKGNPVPSCSWTVFYCLNHTTIDNPYGIEYIGDQNCTLHINHLTVNYTNICFNCTASNFLGTRSYLFNPIDFTFCPEELAIFISANNTREHRDDTLTAFVGDYLELTCDVFGADPFNLPFWLPVNSTNISLFDYGYFTSYDIAKCLRTGINRLGKLSYSDAGYYTCLYGYPYHYSNKTVRLKIVNIPNQVAINKNNNVAVIVPIIVCLSLVSVMFILVIIVVIILIRRSIKLLKTTEIENIPIDYLPFETEYDVFLSFAKEDLIFVETHLKIPLEKAGYKVCWHHDAFIPGYTVLENIERSIFKSRVTIAALSNSYMMSDFCLRELSIASNKMQQTSENCLLPVILEKGCKIPSDVFKITYINCDDSKFLEKVLLSLGNPLSQWEEH